MFTVNNGFLTVAAFVSCMVVFVFPLFLLGTVTPSLVKFTVDSLSDNGKIVGQLNAANTIGSIIGTFVPTFISIPAVGTAVTFLIFAGILLLLSVLYFASARVFKKRIPAALAIFLIACIFGHDASFAFWQKDLTYEGESVYNYLQVYEDDAKVSLSTNVLFGVQSVYRKEPGLTGMYYDYAMAAPFMAGIRENSTEDPFRILILGMGTGTFATQCERYFAGEGQKRFRPLSIEGVEIDDRITALAHDYFHLPEDVPVTTYDGRAYLHAVDQQYDVIMVDAYQDITIPFQMSSLEFFQEVRDHLKDTGVMVVNMNMRGRSEGNINQYLSDTIARVFPEVCTVDMKGSTNRELFASTEPALGERLKEGYMSLLYSDLYADSELSLMMMKVQEGLVAYEPGDYLLTDDKAPVELLGMRVIDEIIQEEVSWYKRIYEEQGIPGVLQAL